MTKNVIVIGISGASGSGKTLLADTIAGEIGSEQVAIIREDAYYKPLDHLSLSEREKVNFDHPDSLDHALLRTHLDELSQGKTIETPTYDFSKHTRTKETYKVGQHRIIILEGILLFTDTLLLRDKIDIRLFIDTPSDICLLRRLKRDIKERGRTMDFVLSQYEQMTRPMYLQFIQPSKRYADIIVPGDRTNRIAIEMIQAKIRELLGENRVR